MDGMNIVAGDLESLAQESSCVAEDIVAKKVGTAFGDASSAMPGSESSKLISETGDSVDKRIKDLSDRYTDFTEKVKASLYEYQQNEGDIQGAMGSVGSSCPSMSGAGGAAAGAAVGAAAGKIANRMGGVAAGAADHSYGSTVGGSDGHSYGSAGETSTDGFLGSPGNGKSGFSGGSDKFFSDGGASPDDYIFQVPEQSDVPRTIYESGGPIVEPIPVSPGDYSVDPIPNADPSGPVIENLSATNEGTA